MIVIKRHKPRYIRRMQKSFAASLLILFLALSVRKSTFVIVTVMAEYITK